MSTLTLQAPFAISARLAPAVKVGDSWLSFDKGRFVLDFADGAEHVVSGFRFPAVGIAGETDADRLQGGFAAVLSFLGACAESRAYARRSGKDEMEGENSDLFPAGVGAWAEENRDEISMLSFELEETKGLLREGVQ